MVHGFSIILAIFWIRAFLGLRIFRTLNPLISIFRSLLFDLLKYFLILLTTLVLFSSIFTIFFRDQCSYKTTFQSFLSLSSDMLGGPGFDSFKVEDGECETDEDDDTKFARFFSAMYIYLVYMVVVVIVVFNFIIAIQGSGYEDRTQYSNTIFVKYVVDLRSSYGVGDNGENWYVCSIVPLNLILIVVRWALYCFRCVQAPGR